MAMPKLIPVEFGLVFPYGVYAVTGVLPVKDFDKSTKDTDVQSLDRDTGLPVWQVEVVDADPEAKKSNRHVAVKIPAKVQPVLPGPVDGLPFTPVEFSGLLALPYVESMGDFSKLSYSFRAEDVHEVRRGSGAAASTTAVTDGESANGSAARKSAEKAGA